MALVYTGLFLLGLLHVHRFRMICLDVLWLARDELRDRCWSICPRGFCELPVVKSIVHSVYFRLLQRGLFNPLLVTVMVAPLASYGFDVKITVANGLIAMFLGVNLVLNSRIGRDVDELVTDWLTQAWHRFRIHVLATFLRFIMDIFSRLLQNIERMLYTVDEWLRFRTGERPLSVAVKAVLGVLWFFVNYFIRFCVTLLIEPQINPIKHFPVVTVSHKILLPLTVPFIHFLQGPAGLGLGRYDRSDNRAVAAGRVRLPGVGAERELASVRRQPPAEPRPGHDRSSRRGDAAVHAPRLPLGHDPQVVCQTAPREPQGLLDRQMEDGQQAPGRAASRGTRTCAASSTATCCSSCITVAAGKGGPSKRASSRWPRTAYCWSCAATSCRPIACGWRLVSASGWLVAANASPWLVGRPA